MEDESIVAIILHILMWLTALLGVIGVLSIAPSCITGIIFLTKSSEKPDDTQKSSAKKKGLFFLFAPFIMIFSSIVIYTLLALLRSVFL